MVSDRDPRFTDSFWYASVGFAGDQASVVVLLTILRYIGRWKRTHQDLRADPALPTI